jgi:hypothetical protein
MPQEIYFITQKDIDNTNTLYNFIYANKEHNYYVSDDFSPAFYISLAQAGFISVSHTQGDAQYLLPEMQFEYAILDFKNLHISKKVLKLLKDDTQYTFTTNKHFNEVLTAINTYHEECWISGKYLELLQELKLSQNDTIDFELCSFEVCNNQGELIAGEVGYMINNIYTSLSGFTLKDKKYNNYSFWNMGHPYMQYKIDLGAKVISRKEFLQRWLKKSLF